VSIREEPHKGKKFKLSSTLLNSQRTESLLEQNEGNYIVHGMDWVDRMTMRHAPHTSDVGRKDISVPFAAELEHKGKL
jgi:hypothetical protein